MASLPEFSVPVGGQGWAGLVWSGNELSWPGGRCAGADEAAHATLSRAEMPGVTSCKSVLTNIWGAASVNVRAVERLIPAAELSHSRKSASQM